MPACGNDFFGFFFQHWAVGDLQLAFRKLLTVRALSHLKKKKEKKKKESKKKSSFVFLWYVKI